MSSQTQDTREQECPESLLEPGEQAQPLLVEPRPGDPDRRVPPCVEGPVPPCSSPLGAEEAGLRSETPQVKEKGQRGARPEPRESPEDISNRVTEAPGPRPPPRRKGPGPSCCRDGHAPSPRDRPGGRQETGVSDFSFGFSLFFFSFCSPHTHQKAALTGCFHLGCCRLVSAEEGTAASPPTSKRPSP